MRGVWGGPHRQGGGGVELPKASGLSRSSNETEVEIQRFRAGAIPWTLAEG